MAKAPELVNETWQALWRDLCLYENTIKTATETLQSRKASSERLLQLRGELKAIREIKKRMLQLDKE